MYMYMYMYIIELAGYTCSYGDTDINRSDWMGKGDVGICYTKSHKYVHKRKQSEMEKCSAHG